jgi:hypothetical protein
MGRRQKPHLRIGPIRASGVHQGFRNEFGACILRARNYFVRPRRKPENSLYAAIHFELQDEYGTFMEIQFMTVRRNAICLIDHSLTPKSLVAFGAGGKKVGCKRCLLPQIFWTPSNEKRVASQPALRCGRRPRLDSGGEEESRRGSVDPKMPAS